MKIREMPSLLLVVNFWIRLGRFYVQKILSWEDITTEKGTLVASWPAGATEPVWNWI